MDQLGQAFMTRLTTDAELQAKGAVIRAVRTPEDPKVLQVPLVGVLVSSDNDRLDLHGASQTVGWEIHVWGWSEFNRANYGACMAVAQRISEVVKSDPFRLADTSVGMRPLQSFGWQTITDAKFPHLVHLFARFEIQYWSAQIISTL